MNFPSRSWPTLENVTLFLVKSFDRFTVSLIDTYVHLIFIIHNHELSAGALFNQQPTLRCVHRDKNIRTQIHLVPSFIYMERLLYNYITLCLASLNRLVNLSEFKKRTNALHSYILWIVLSSRRSILVKWQLSTRACCVTMYSILWTLSPFLFTQNLTRLLLLFNLILLSQENGNTIIFAPSPVFESLKFLLRF